jgi:hypothetical protein
MSPWHLLDADGKTFVDLAITDLHGDGDETQILVKSLAKAACLDEEANPSERWAALRCLEKWKCKALDDLMTQTGLVSVKHEALKLFCAVKEDEKRPKHKQVIPGSTVNFAFVGNPGILVPL